MNTRSPEILSCCEKRYHEPPVLVFLTVQVALNPGPNMREPSGGLFQILVDLPQGERPNRGQTGKGQLHHIQYRTPSMQVLYLLVTDESKFTSWNGPPLHEPWNINFLTGRNGKTACTLFLYNTLTWHVGDRVGRPLSPGPMFHNLSRLSPVAQLQIEVLGNRFIQFQWHDGMKDDPWRRLLFSSRHGACRHAQHKCSGETCLARN